MKKVKNTLTEPMYYIMAAINQGLSRGIDMIRLVELASQGRIKLGPATFYTLVNQLIGYGYIKTGNSYEISYVIKKRGLIAFQNEQTWSLDINRIAYIKEEDEPEPSEPDVEEKETNPIFEAVKEEKEKHYYRMLILWIPMHIMGGDMLTTEEISVFMPLRKKMHENHIRILRLSAQHYRKYAYGKP